MNLKTVTALVIAAAFAAPLAAQTAGSPAQPKDRSASGATAGGFASMDRNSDGYISRDEARDASWNSRFSELDKDNDGRLSQSEFNAMQEAASGSGASTTGGMGGSVGPAGTQSGSSTHGIGDKPGQKQ